MAWFSSSWIAVRISGSLALFIAFFLCSYYFNLLLACVAFPFFSFLFVFLFPILFFSFCLSLPLFLGIQLLLCGFYCLFLTLYPYHFSKSLPSLLFLFFLPLSFALICLLRHFIELRVRCFLVILIMRWYRKEQIFLFFFSFLNLSNQILNNDVSGIFPRRVFFLCWCVTHFLCIFVMSAHHLHYSFLQKESLFNISQSG